MPASGVATLSLSAGSPNDGSALSVGEALAVYTQGYNQRDKIRLVLFSCQVPFQFGLEVHSIIV